MSLGCTDLVVVGGDIMSLGRIDLVVVLAKQSLGFNIQRSISCHIVKFILVNYGMQRVGR